MVSAITTTILNRNSTKGRNLGINLKTEIDGYNGTKFMVEIPQPYFFLSMEPSNEHYKDYMIHVQEGKIRHCVPTRARKFFDYMSNKEFTSLEAWYEDAMGPSSSPMRQVVRFGRHRTNNYSYEAEGSVSLDDLLEMINPVHVSGATKNSVSDGEMTIEEIYNSLGSIGRGLFLATTNKFVRTDVDQFKRIIISRPTTSKNAYWLAYTDLNKKMTRKLSDLGATPSNIFILSENACDYTSLQKLMDTQI